jgi:hypothetical protein
MAVRKMLWKHTDNLGIPLNDKLLGSAVYKTILASPGNYFTPHSFQKRSKTGHICVQKLNGRPFCFYHLITGLEIKWSGLDHL